MTNEERDIITNFIQRVSGAQPATGGSVPATTTPLPPVDRDADSHISGLFNQYPDARYRLTQTAFVQEHALAEAQNRIQRLQADLQTAQQQQKPQSRGFLGSLFGGGQSQAQPQPQQPQYQPQPQYQQPQYAPPPQPMYAPGYQPGMLQRGGSGFLGSALTTAAGVAGGMVAGNALMGLFSEHHGGGYDQGGNLGGGGGPWGGAAGGGGWDQATDAAPASGGGWDNVVNQPDNSSGFDNSGFDNSGFDSGGGGFDSGGGGGFDDSSNT